ncbi:hypothetical protein J2S40_000416 [Nocardioides luteus]|uniref:hypothetical protein n=1 Tax=Nocardioides luteus TaxID=1844 RepID=UPI001665882C|nr:hypothetical protein [Nocardioides luteus]MDR7309358.1 hypothetical protein [Nocardioides luteus]
MPRTSAPGTITSGGTGSVNPPATSPAVLRAPSTRQTTVVVRPARGAMPGVARGLGHQRHRDEREQRQRRHHRQRERTEVLDEDR